MTVNKTEALRRTAQHLRRTSGEVHSPKLKKAMQREATRARVDYEAVTGHTLPLRRVG